MKNEKTLIIIKILKRFLILFVLKEIINIIDSLIISI